MAITINGNGTVTGDLEFSGKQTVKHDDWDGLRVENTNADANGAYLDLVKDSASPADGDETGVIRFRADDDAGNAHTFAVIRGTSPDVSNGAENGQIEFHTSSGGTVAERLRITQSGNLKILDGDLQINTAGHGIDFSATADGSGTSSVSELFDDYEEGQFTPTYFTGVTTPGYNAQVGHYQKVGNWVHWQIYLDLSSGTPNSDHLTIRGFPYTVNSSSARGGGQYGWSQYSGSFHLYHNDTNSDLQFYGGTGGQTAQTGATVLTPGDAGHLFGSYMVA